MDGCQVNPLEYADWGWHIFPCHAIVRGACSCPAGPACESPGKHPRTKNGVKDATTDHDTITAWMNRWPDAINWAVACGHLSGLVVIDIDTRKNGFASIEELEQNRYEGPLPNTRKASTGGGGRHLFYKYPTTGLPVGNRVGWLPGVDVKANGGYVMLPPSSHISGGTYSWVDASAPIIELPVDILQSIRNSPGSGSHERLPDTDDILKGVPEGKRDDTLFKACCRWRRQLGDNRAAVETLALTAARACDPPFPDDQALKCVESAFKQDHHDTPGLILKPGEEGSGFYPLTDLGNAKRFIENYGDNVLYVDGWGWLVWGDTGWHRDSLGAVAQMSHKISAIVTQERNAMAAAGQDLKTVARHARWAEQTESAGSISAITRLARDDKAVRKSVQDFDSDDFQLACRNGIVDLKTGKIRPLDRDDLVTKNTGVFYDPDFKLDRWDDFLLESCEGGMEMVEYLQRAAGYTLTGSNAEEVFFMVSGPPASGKSTFLDGLHAALGSYGTVTQPDTFMYRRGQQTPPNELARLAGMRMVSMSEVKEGESFSEAIIKQFTGGDKVTARFLYQDSFEFRPQLKLWIGTNNDPNIYDSALWRRTKKVPFYNSIPRERRDPALKAAIRDKEIGGRAVLAWAVKGVQMWLEAGSLKEPARMQHEILAYQSDQDRPGQFIRECLLKSSDARVPLNDVFTAYRLWCMRVNEPIKRQPQFLKMMTGHGLRTVRDDANNVYFCDLVVKEGVNQWS